MKTQAISKSPGQGFTLLEMSLVIGVLLALMSTGMFVSSRVGDWRMGRAAAETLREVFTAQRMFLAENPTRQVSSITAEDIIPYLPSGATTIPTVESLTGDELGIVLDASPPYVNAGTDARYDPSGSNSDGLWDVGE